MPRAKEIFGHTQVRKSWSGGYCEKKLLPYEREQSCKDLKSCTSIKLPNAGETRHSFKLHIVHGLKYTVHKTINTKQLPH